MMIALEQERGKKKCEVYWPAKLNEPQEWGKAKITMVHEDRKGEIFTERHLRVKFGDLPEMSVVQYQFLKWPDFDVPSDQNIGEVLEYLRIISETYRRVKPEQVRKFCILIFLSKST
jgi:protein tyrosine phosphatase